jgi:hypothetical protein
MKEDFNGWNERMERMDKEQSRRASPSLASGE